MRAVSALLLLAACASGAEDVDVPADSGTRTNKSLGPGGLAAGCLLEGAWHAAGARVSAACLRCACRLGALSCRRAACAPLPDPPPPRCHITYRKDACCPDLHCPDGVKVLEEEAVARSEDDDDIISPTSLSHVFPACVEGGSVFAAGSALGAGACEHCYCLGGARRCVRPRCLAPPPGCRAPPARGLCCPERYHCARAPAPLALAPLHHPHDCKVNDTWVGEGERVPSADKCSQCFCLRGAVRCEAPRCAPPLRGCRPLLRPGHCCPHQYICEHKHDSQIVMLSNNALSAVRNDERAFHASRTKHESTTKNTLANVYTAKNTPKLTATKNHLISTTKVKRKTSDPPPEATNPPPEVNTTVTATSTTTTAQPTTESKTTQEKMATTAETSSQSSTTPMSYSTTELTTEMTSTEQPEGSVRIMINGTINCTAELSSTSLPLNITFNDTEKITQESHPRVPLIDVSSLEDHTFSANDIITDRTVNGDFDDNESFVINVTSSLNANSHTKPAIKINTTKSPFQSSSVTAPVVSTETNSSKKTKGDYDYDYTEPTLPPSLPNLKIIPFVAADAVVEDDTPKEAYPVLEREDKFPVYYPTVETKDSAYVTRRDDVYRSTQFPVFITDKPDMEQYPSLTSDVDLTNTGYSDIQPDVEGSISEYTAAASLGNRAPDAKPITQAPPTTTTSFKIETPAVNLFSPPVETEGGFIPKGPTGLIEEYFAVFPSTPPPAPHLTTSMQLDIRKECVSNDGRRVPEGESISLACSTCACAWGELHCTPRPCHTPAGCTRRPASVNTGDICCGDLICSDDKKTTETPDHDISNAKSTVPVAQTTEERTTKDNIAATDMSTTTSTTTKIDPMLIESIGQTQLSHNDNHLPDNETIKNNTSTTTEKLTKHTTTTTPSTVYKVTTANNSQPLEYEEEDDDEGFSFGSVLKLLLSENYDSTTAAPKKVQTSTRAPPVVKTTTTTRRPKPTAQPFLPPKASISPFVPLPIHSYKPSKGNQNSINRIDHLVLGEATAIKKTTPRPVTTTVRAVTTNRPASRPTTGRTTPKPTELTIEGSYSTQDAPRPAAGLQGGGMPGGGLPGLGPGLLKLAGCNIYGRMYRVGRIITELSTECQECWCTEFGVQCKQLPC